MILPIGREDSTLSRWPYVVIALVCLNLAAFFVLLQPAQQAEVAASEAETAVLGYYAEHPYLDLPAGFVLPGMDSGAVQELRQRVADEARPDNPLEVADQQTHLDNLGTWADGVRASHPFNTWGFRPAEPRLPALFSSMFVHASWYHLVGNLLFLLVLGLLLEGAYGGPLLAALYLGTGVIGALCHMAAQPESSVPLVGAAGAISGLMGVLLARHAQARIRCFWWLVVSWGTVAIPAIVLLPLWFADRLALALLPGGFGASGAWAADLGGFAAGVGAALLVRYLELERDGVVGEEALDIEPDARPHYLQALDALSEGKPELAVTRLQSAEALDPRSPAVAEVMWRALRQLNDTEHGATYGIRLVREAIRRGNGALARRVWRELGTFYQEPLQPALRWQLGQLLEPDDRPGAVELYRTLVNDPDARELGVRAHGRLEAMGASDTGGAPVRAKARLSALDGPSEHDIGALTMAVSDVGSISMVGKAALAPTSLARLDEPLDLPGQAAAAAGASAGAASQAHQADDPDADQDGLLTGPFDVGLETADTLPAHTPAVSLSNTAPTAPPKFEPEPVPARAPSPPGPTTTAAFDVEAELSRTRLGPPVAKGPTTGTHPVAARRVRLGAMDPARMHFVGEEPVAFRAVDAVAVGVIGSGPARVVVLDLVLNWRSREDDGEARVLRLDSRTTPDAAAVVGEPAATAEEAFAALGQRIMGVANALPLSEPSRLAARDVETFRSLKEFERVIYDRART